MVSLNFGNMNSFKVGSYQLVKTNKWVPAGNIFIDNNNTRNIQEIDFPPENRFNTKDEANNFFREYYLREGYIESE